MNYISSRGRTAPVSSAQAIKSGLAPDGGLFVPGKTVTVAAPERWAGLGYHALAIEILSLFLTDFTSGELHRAIDAAYRTGKFAAPEVVTLHQLAPPLHFLELWHGPTCAFKDIALQLLPHLLVRSMEKTGEDAGILILVATSGDTGKAALEGFRDVERTRIIVFYPQEGVSEIQKQQMITQEGKNVSVIAVQGNFDDAQSGVKSIFADDSMRKKIAARGYKFSSATSINWGACYPRSSIIFTPGSPSWEKEISSRGNRSILSSPAAISAISLPPIMPNAWDCPSGGSSAPPIATMCWQNLSAPGSTTVGVILYVPSLRQWTS